MDLWFSEALISAFETVILREAEDLLHVFCIACFSYFNSITRIRPSE